MQKIPLQFYTRLVNLTKWRWLKVAVEHDQKFFTPTNLNFWIWPKFTTPMNITLRTKKYVVSENNACRLRQAKYSSLVSNQIYSTKEHLYYYFTIVLRQVLKMCVHRFFYPSLKRLQSPSSLQNIVPECRSNLYIFQNAHMRALRCCFSCRMQT